jgi:hypothetical protein
LTSGEGTDHDQSSAHTGEETLDTELTRHLNESGSGRLSWCSLGLVDLGEQSVGRLRDDGGGHTGDQTTGKVNTHLLTTGEGVLGLAGELEDLLGSDFEDGELGHGVGNLLEEDGTETSVESTGTFLSEDPQETGRKTGSESGLRNQSDSGSLKGTKGNVGEELGDGRGSEVDGLSVVSGIVNTEVLDGLLLPELVTDRQP